MTATGLPTNLHELLRAQAAAAPDALGVITPTQRWSRSTWSAQAERVAAALLADGIEPGDTVALLAPSSADWLAVAFGCAAVGARLAPFNTWTKGPELDYLLTFVRPRALVTVPGWSRQDFLGELRVLVPEAWEQPAGAWQSARVPSLQRLVVLGDGAPVGGVAYEEWLGAGRYEGPVRRSADDVALVLFTSGSTARPKGVALTHTDVIANGFEIGERQGLGADDRLLLASPLFWSLGSANALPASLTHGAALVLVPQFDPAAVLQLVEREQVSAMYTLASITEALLDDPGFDRRRVASLERGLTFGPPSQVRRVVEELGITSVCNIYGATEVYGNCVVSPSTAAVERRIAASGPPLDGVELAVVDVETRRPLPAGAVGEVLVRGRVTPGYLDASGGLQPVVDDEGWFATGDLGWVDEEGWMTFSGRNSEMIKTSGINVSPAEVEAVLLDHVDVVEVAVTGAEHPRRGEEVVAFVRLRVGASAGPDDLRRWAGERAASYKVPSRVLVVDAMPTTSTGKLARRELRAMAEEGRDEPEGGRDER